MIEIGPGSFERDLDLLKTIVDLLSIEYPIWVITLTAICIVTIITIIDYFQNRNKEEDDVK